MDVQDAEFRLDHPPCRSLRPCGFFGSASHHGLCSACFTETDYGASIPVVSQPRHSLDRAVGGHGRFEFVLGRGDDAEGTTFQWFHFRPPPPASAAGPALLSSGDPTATTASASATAAFAAALADAAAAGVPAPPMMMVGASPIRRACRRALALPGLQTSDEGWCVEETETRERGRQRQKQ